MTVIKVSKAKTRKYCRMLCGKAIEEKELFVRIGEFPDDRPIHFECIPKAVKHMKGDIVTLENIHKTWLKGMDK